MTIIKNQCKECSWLLGYIAVGGRAGPAALEQTEEQHKQQERTQKQNGEKEGNIDGKGSFG
jgi:hypothetical protein